MEFVQYDVLRQQLSQGFLREPQKLRVGHELHIGKTASRIPLLVLKDIVIGRQPQKPGIRVVLDELKGEQAFPCTGGMNHSGTAIPFQYGKHRFVGSSVVLVKLQASRSFLFTT